MVGNGRGAAPIAAVDAEILDHLQDLISVVVESAPCMVGSDTNGPMSSRTASPVIT
jgi:hypothetical protein